MWVILIKMMEILLVVAFLILIASEVKPKLGSLALAPVALAVLIADRSIIFAQKYSECLNLHKFSCLESTVAFNDACTLLFVIYFNLIDLRVK